ncbi:MAG: pyridoxamine 5'-phosphate oxidase [Rhodothermales bacterium]
MAKIDIAALRREYIDQSLDESEVDPDPIEQFGRWFQQVVEIDARDASAMTLATVDHSGQPSARIVLLKGYDSDGLVFFTNYGSDKARELEANPKVALVFWWTELDRQVRIKGTVKRTSNEESWSYFATRPRGSQISATVSPQSRVVPDRQTLVDLVRAAERECEGRDVTCPTAWGGYRLVPHEFEFWQGRPTRLHDRVRYRKNEQGRWIIERLAP